MNWIDRSDELALARQCALAGVARATVYRPAGEEFAPSAENLLYCRLIDEEYTRRSFYGSRKMVVFLRGLGHAVNRKRVRRLMRVLGLQGMAPGPATSTPHPQHKIYPYLLRGISITRPNQVWSTDITYIRLPRGFMYLVAVVDWYSRKVLAWRLSNTLESAFCVDCLEDALSQYGTPEIFNSDQGSQFTSAAFTGALEARGIRISMDGRGRALDNVFVERLWRSVKHEDIYLKGYQTVGELTIGLAAYFAFYNGERAHQALGYRAPNGVYEEGIGGGASIPDRFGDARQESPSSLRSSGDSCRAEATATPNATTGQRRSAADVAVSTA